MLVTSVAMPSGRPSRYSISATDDLTVFLSPTRLVPRIGPSVGKLWWNLAMLSAETQKSRP